MKAMKKVAMFVMACMLAFGGMAAAVPQSRTVVSAEAATAQQIVNKVGIKSITRTTKITNTGDYKVTLNWTTYDRSSSSTATKSMSGYYTGFRVVVKNLKTGGTNTYYTSSKSWSGSNFRGNYSYKVTITPRYRSGNSYKYGYSYSTTFTVF